uniref:Uncharacterized protein n=1 Tax=Amphimedon queenslandica TaxID=400682 RepID=A0A1X7T6I6_AMPQE
MADHKKITDVLTSLNADNDYSVSICYRLVRYSNTAQCPRPVLVKFNKAIDVSFIWSRRRALQPPIVIKPQMTQEECQVESILLRKRWDLIQSNVPKSEIRINGRRLYVNGHLHGQVSESSTYIASPSFEGGTDDNSTVAHEGVDSLDN